MEKLGLKSDAVKTLVRIQALGLAMCLSELLADDK